MHLGLDISLLNLEGAGLHTYTYQLLQHLAQLDESPALTFIDGAGRSSRQQLFGINKGLLTDARYVRMRALPSIRSMRGPWRNRYIGFLPSVIDECILLPSWQWAEGTIAGPYMARWRLPYNVSVDLDVCHWPFDTLVRLPNVAHVVTIHDTIVLRNFQWHPYLYAWAHARKLRLMARCATRLIADSENTRCDMVNLLGVDSARIDVIPLAAGPEFHPPADVDRDTYLATLARYGLREGDYIICVGTIEPRKNLVRLAAGFKAAVERRPELTTKLVLAGGKGWKMGPIERGLAEAGLGERLVLPGRASQEDLPALLHGARAVAYVSLYEGFGLPPLEAMACGTPVVASNNSSIPEVVGDAGLLVDPYDVEAIAAALGQVLTDDGLRAELAARGLRRAARFSWAKTAELTMQTYRRALADHQLAMGRS